MTLGRAITARDAGRLRSILVAGLLMVATALCPIGASAAEAPGKHEHGDMPGKPIIFGLTGMQLAIAAVVGTGLGAAAAITARRMTVGAGLGLLATVYIAHLGVEALVVGGVYYLWPSEPSPEPEGALPTSASVMRISGLNLAASTRQATP